MIVRIAHIIANCLAFCFGKSLESKCGARSNACASAECGMRSAEQPYGVRSAECGVRNGFATLRYANKDKLRINFRLWFPLTFPRLLIDFGFWMKYEQKKISQGECTRRTWPVGRFLVLWSRSPKNKVYPEGSLHSAYMTRRELFYFSKPSAKIARFSFTKEWEHPPHNASNYH